MSTNAEALPCDDCDTPDGARWDTWDGRAVCDLCMDWHKPDPASYGLGTYVVTLKSDLGTKTLDILTTSLDRAAELACYIEDAPRHAVKTITRR